MRNIEVESVGLAEAFVVGDLGKNQKYSQVPGIKARMGVGPEGVMARESGPGTLSQWASPFPAPTKGSPGPSLASCRGSCSLICSPQVRETAATPRGLKVK